MHLLLLSIFCILANCQAGILEGFAPQVIGGRDAKPGEFPYQVSLQTGPNSSDTVHFCGGSIINPHWILTAAHCVGFEVKTPSYFVFLVKAGKINLAIKEEGEQMSLYEKSFMHPDFVNNDIPQPNDMGLVKIKTPLKFTKKVQPIALPPLLSEFSGIATVSGWGKDSDAKDAKSTPPHLHTADLPLISRETCQNMTTTEVDETNICCGPKTFGKTFCQGDSGGPLVITDDKTNQKLVIGAVSWGDAHCGTPPSVFARVSYFVDWIDKKIATN